MFAACWSFQQAFLLRTTPALIFFKILKEDDKSQFFNKSIAILLFPNLIVFIMTETLYVPSLPPALKHPTVFKKFDALQQGEIVDAHKTLFDI